ncbi:hypothetical protein CsatA_019865 [Cannabis sativa]
MEGVVVNKEKSDECRVCVTGGSGYIASWLVKKLLERGYTVHATLRNLDDESKVSVLKGFPGAERRLFLFKADIYKPDEFDSAIQGCAFVFHVATLFLQPNATYEKTVSAAVAGTRSIAMSCARSGSVRKLIYTASVVSASPIIENGTAFKDFIDESCWTPMDLPFTPYTNDFLKAYQESKTLAEKEVLSFEKENAGNIPMEVVTLACGLVGGESVQRSAGDTLKVIVSQLTNNQDYNKSLKYLEELIGKIPIVHIDDVCEAHIFCMENPSIHARVLCASDFVSSSEIASYFAQNCPEFDVKQQYLEGPSRKIKWASHKLTDLGFAYKYDLKMILDDTVSCAKRFGYLQS